MIDNKDYFFYFNVSINDEEAQLFKTKNSFYNVVALEVVEKMSMNDKNTFVKVEIWQDSMLSKFKKITYLVKDGKAKFIEKY